MNVIAAVVAGTAVILLVARISTRSLTERVRWYITGPERQTADLPVKRDRDLSFLPWSLAGAFAGVLLAQGDLFLAGASRSAPPLALVGGVAGWIAWSARRSTLRERRSLRLRHELPLVADALALHTLAGESVAFALDAVVEETDGVASEEFRSVLRMHAEGQGLVEALAEGKRCTAHAEATRLYEALIHAHTSGGRLADALGDLSIDFRSSISTDLTSEGGRRAVTSYGPILALMVPTALLFLLYPTLLGLRALSGAP
ncbi:MAG: type II secretion system F family protein [Actinomycetia bacterium]|nr:type II secretion system F family protein [Actinomycetes bacterium]